MTVFGWFSPENEIIDYAKEDGKEEEPTIDHGGRSTFQHLVGWIGEMVSVLSWQVIRLAKSIVVGSNAKNRLISSVNEFYFVSGKIEAVRFHRILLQCCSNNASSVIEKASKSATYIPELPEKRKAICIVNPLSGNRLAASMMQDLQPFIESASDLIEFTIQFTTHSQHAKEIAAELNKDEYNVVICVGGDGTPFEVVNGIMSRKDGEDLIRNITIGIIPAGTGNGITSSLGIVSPQQAILRIIHGNTKQFDVMKIEQENNENFEAIYSLLQVSYGMMSDVDFDSEKVRIIGDLRYLTFLFVLNIS